MSERKTSEARKTFSQTHPKLRQLGRDARRSALELQGMIGAAKLLKMLNDYASKIEDGKEPTQGQITVAMFLLNKVLPNLASMKVSHTQEQKMVVFNMPTVARSSEEWEGDVEEHRALAAKPVNGHAGNGS